MLLRSMIALSLMAVMLIACFAGCSPVKSDPENPGGETDAPDATGALTPEPTPIEIPDEDFTGMNTSADPLPDDGDGEAILARLTKNKLIKNTAADPAANVTRKEFAYDVIYWSGFAAQEKFYICANDYLDVENYSDDMVHAEIAVNQGYMLRPVDKMFKPDEPVTYGEMLRGTLYALGYREYADFYGVVKLAAETGLSNYIDLAKKNSETVTYAEYAQVVSNAMRMNIVQCVKRNGELYTVPRGDNYVLQTAYIKNKVPENEAIFKCANEGWEIYPGGGYRYGPSMIINGDGTLDVWTASNSGVSGEIDWGKYRRSYDGGITWTQDTGAVRPTSAAEDWNWSCDPGIIKIGEYYYATYTTILWHDGLDNNLFVARSKTPQGAFVEKWTGSGWGYGDPKPIVTYDGQKAKWGCGEGSSVVVGNTLYLYCSCNDNMGDFTKVYTADANDPNWPATLKYRGIMYKHDSAEDSCEVKFIDAYNCFLSVATASRFSDKCYVHIMTSFDGLCFRQESVLSHAEKSSNIQTHIHNMGITGDEHGHIDIFNTQHYIGYAYQPDGYSWGNWPTRLTPVVFVGTDNYDHPENVISNKNSGKSNLDKKHTPDVTQIRAESSGSRNVEVQDKSKSYTFRIAALDKDGGQYTFSSSDYKKLEYFYDDTKLRVDTKNHSVKLLSDSVERLYIKYNDLMCEIAVVPAYLDNSAPVEFYPEVETLTFYFKKERKQPAFIARSARNEYLMLWGNKSSITDANAKDYPAALAKWSQEVELSGWDPNIISVSANGQVTPKGIGETVITAKYMGFEATIKVEVLDMG
ncbi:MAG: S-layer homology domain-containing protein [Clostridia bacterium]|nr:S-layer homology domain-containing protein [Clostridia bacterium]